MTKQRLKLLTGRKEFKNSLCLLKKCSNTSIPFIKGIQYIIMAVAIVTIIVTAQQKQ